MSDRTDIKIKDNTSSIKRINSDTSPSDGKFVTISTDASIENNYRVCISHDEGIDRNESTSYLTFKTFDVLYR